jgi:DNA-binding transcriptional MocR family regulator
MGAGWVSHMLQRLVVALWSDRAAARRLRQAAATYTRRRDSLIAALARHGIPAQGRSGLNVWVPVAEEATTVAHLAAGGWAVRAGERYRLRSAAAVRITVSRLSETAAARLAADLARVLKPATTVPAA